MYSKYILQCYKEIITQMSQGRKTKKVTVETTSKLLEYVTKGHIATYTILLQNSFII